MKKLKTVLLLFLALSAGIVIDRSWRSGPAAALPLPVATANGDANGDGQRDLSDAIYLLEWLFLTGPEPVPFAADCPPRFADNGDGTVTDTKTGLMWQKETYDADANGTIDEQDKVAPDAKEAAVQGLTLGGHTDWRIPIQDELESLIDFLRYPAIDPIFPCMCEYSDSYWMASTNGSDPCHGCPMAMNFTSGITSILDPAWSPKAYIRAVRGEQWSPY